MDRFKFIQPRLGFEVGRIVDESTLRLGIIRTLVSMRVLEKVEDDKLDDPKNVKPAKSGSKPRRSKGTSKGGRKRTGRPDPTAD
jgi:hypothetical protein